MRAFSGVLALATAAGLLAAGCGGTVYRLPGEAVTPGGAATTPCESERFLVIAPTRAEVVDEGKGTSHPVNGLGLYHVGSDSPESIPAVEDFHSPSVEHKRDVAASYDRKQIVAGSLGTAGVIAIAIGTILFVNAFETTSSVNPATGTVQESNSVNGTKAGLGGGIVGLGFALGISGLVINPSNAERTRTRATGHVFFDPPDSPKSVEKLVEGHNARARSACSAAP